MIMFNSPYVFNPEAPMGRRDWELSMVIRSAQKAVSRRSSKENAAIPKALTLGAGTDASNFYLLRYCDVIATDQYGLDNEWLSYHPADFMTDPFSYAPDDLHSDEQSIVGTLDVRYMDMLDMSSIEDNSMDFISSVSSIEHVGNPATFPDYSGIDRVMDGIAAKLVPGGMASLTFEWLVSGDVWGFDNVHLMTPELYNKHIVGNRGLKPFGTRSYTINDETASRVHAWADILAGNVPISEVGLIDNKGIVFTSYHTLLVKNA